MAGYRIFDIETIPDHSVWTPPEPKWFMRPMALTSYDGTTIYDIKESFRYGTSLNNALLLPDEPFPPPQAHRIVAISYVDLSADDEVWYQFESANQLCDWSSSKPDEVERELISDFVTTQAKDLAILVSWNGRSFDLPVINMRAFRHGVPMSWYYNERDVRYRYTESGHCDLMDVFSDYGAARNMKLGDVARCIGLPGKTHEVSGSSVALTVSKGESEDLKDSVSDYCLSDSFQTAFLFIRSRLHKGMIDVSYYNEVIDSFRNSSSLKRVLPTFDLEKLKLK